MAEIIRMPEVLAGAEEAAIQTWLVSPGASVAVGGSLAEIETDKAIVELAAEADGVIGRLLVSEGDSVAVGDPIIVMLASGESDAEIDKALADIGVAGPAPAPTVDPVPAAPEPETAPETPSPTAASGSTVPGEPRATDSADATGSGGATSPPGDENEGRRLFASPLVRRLAAERGISLQEIRGTGPHGRVVRRDLQNHLAPTDAPVRPTDEAAGSQSSTPSAAEGAVVPPAASSAGQPQATPGVAYEDLPLDRMRRAIARRLAESKSTVPHFYLVADCRVDDLLELRRTVNESAPRKISVNDFVLKAVAAALTDVPAANAIWNGDSIRRFSSVDLAVAVATEGGLTTPVLRAVERMSLTSVSTTVADMAERARAGRLKQHELEGGSFSVSNLGMYGTSQFSAILNPPQSGILAVGSARAMPVVGPDGELSVGQVMTVTLSADHRVLDGAVAAQWLAAFQRRIEDPLTILI